MKVEFLEADMHYLHGTWTPASGITYPLPRGTGLRAHDTDEGKLVLADLVDGYVLERDLVANTTQAEMDARMLETVMPTDFAKPYVAGATVSVRRVTRMQLEGADVILTSGTGAVSGSTGINSPLSYKFGKLRVAQSGDEVVYRLRRQLTAEDSANVFRLEVAREGNPVV